ncbi:MAG TPA: 16S rRNA (cytidine(1402)-2'-O)-methyltransferase [Candidatus Kaiserbacteria bacterium]|nr:16S rRNA (cytidine(1402)-2'-O)-methyltransferase [Candidatus Kaiserbacteria bacterium]
MGTLFVVATPIGNLGDITFRAIEALKSVEVIACEDTRVTARLLARYEIKKPLVIFHAHNARASGARILGLLSQGKNVALVTDAGTPGVSDPGNELVASVRHELPDARIEVIPGASALTAALSIAGAPTSTFIFLGFLPHKKGRKKLFEEIANAPRPIVFYESPHRILKTLSTLADTLSPQHTVTVARELTKIHESVVIGSAKEVEAHFISASQEVRGEFVLIITH